ncbi:hypothetical protein ACS8E3_06260 [Psychrobacter sp. 2Y5]|uniref:hypothetical protein n=1 Tax=unclassified Psychrobacter TaxID=196806 RepID=UPI000C338D74|nr:hypothetical protein [Psychrobacter sp. Sarcosine-3u-12]PKG35700.1 hypothetical protein CXF65_06160 [Psychrobacter sp. Sarcosine-3u-12]
MKTKLEYQSDITETNKLICERYWLREADKRSGFIYTCKEIGQEFDVKHQDIPSIVKINAHLVVLDCQCIDCGTTKICHTRSQLTQLKPDSWRCDDCWDTFQERRNQEYLEYNLKQDRLAEEYKQDVLAYINYYRDIQLTNIPVLTALNDVDRFLLAATVESLGVENLRTTVSLRDNLLLPLSPFSKLDEEILHHLFKRNLLILAPENSYKYVTIDEEQELEVDFYQAIFEFSYSIENLTKISINAKSRKNTSALVADSQFKSWCEKVQLGECLNYLITRSRLNDLAPPIGDKLISILRACLAEYSVSTIHYIIYEAVESAAAYVQKPNITRKRASNSISDNIERIFDKLYSGSWTPNIACRNFSHPQSAMAKIFFDYMFGVNDGGFYYTLDELFSPYRSQKALEQVSYATLGNTISTSYSIRIASNIN